MVGIQGKTVKAATVMKFNELISWESLKFLHFFWDHYVIFKTIYSVCIAVINVQILFSTTNCSQWYIVIHGLQCYPFTLILVDGGTNAFAPKLDLQRYIYASQKRENARFIVFFSKPTDLKESVSSNPCQVVYTHQTAL